MAKVVVFILFHFISKYPIGRAGIKAQGTISRISCFVYIATVAFCGLWFCLHSNGGIFAVCGFM
jgi:hypothetical protein